MNPDAPAFYPAAPLSPRVQRAASKSARRRKKMDRGGITKLCNAGSISVQDLKHLTAMRLAQPLSVSVPVPAFKLNVITPAKSPSRVENEIELEEPLTPEPPSPLFMNCTSPPSLIQVDETQIIECRGTPRSQPFALRKKVGACDELKGASQHISSAAQTSQQQNVPLDQSYKIDKNGRPYKVQVGQEGSHIYTKIVYLDEDEIKLPLPGLGQGKVRQINGNYGFIRDNRFPNYDLFFHLSEVAMENRDTIDTGSRVRFIIDEDPWRTSRKAKFKAIDVHLA